jgi:glycosyltransferase involved in cell wall biosynthesis
VTADLSRFVVQAQGHAQADSQDPTFSVVMPTVGRSTLLGALKSVAPQMQPGDELLVVCNNKHDRGDWARNSAVERARASHLIFLDDDDQFVPGALAAMRAFALEHPARIGIFRMELWDGSCLWSEPVLRYGNVGSPMFVVPNIPGKLGKWDQTRIANDWAFIEETVALQREPIFCDLVVAQIRPNGPFANRWIELRFRLRLRTRLRRALRTARASAAGISR